MDQNSRTIILINNSRTAWPTWILMLFLSSSLDNLYKMHTCISFFKKVLIILRQNTKHANFWLGVHYPIRARSQILVLGLTGRPEARAQDLVGIIIE